jgi:hypothetical protein
MLRKMTSNEAQGVWLRAAIVVLIGTVLALPLV